MREAVDNAVSLSTNMPTFFSLMRQQGYEIDHSRDRKYPTIKSLNSKKATRLYRLGEDYGLERIIQRVYDNTLECVVRNRDELRSSLPPPVRNRAHVNGTRNYKMKITGIYAQYLHLLYLMGYRPKKKHLPLSPEMREACRMCDKYSTCARLMAREHMRTDQDVREFITGTEQRIDMLSVERNKIRNLLRREKDPYRINDLKDERNRLTDEISSLRKDIKTAEFILERSDEVSRIIEIEEAVCGRKMTRKLSDHHLIRNDRGERDAR